jgi:hypothetical protein
LRCPRAIE